MAYFKEHGVMLLVYTTLILSLFAALTLASICPEKQYLNSRQQTCINCTDCKDGTVVLRPCEIHRDTHCGSISELLRTMEVGKTGNRHRHRHQQKHAEPQEEVIWRFGDDVVRQEAAVAQEVASSEAPFSSAETLVWDWQAVALTSAVFACILFFLVIAFYSLHQAKQWRRLKENFEADVEELSARLSLMAAEKGGDALKGVSALKGIDALNGVDALKGVHQEIQDKDDNYLNLNRSSKCVYLEQLLSVRNGYKIRTLPKGNVYIDEANPKT